MKADLKSLRDRLGDEVGELGIDGEKAEDLLATHYKEQDKNADDSDAAPPKVSLFYGFVTDADLLYNLINHFLPFRSHFFLQRTRRAIREAPPPVTLKTTRRRRSNSSDSEGIGAMGETNDFEDAMFEEKMAATNSNSADEDGEGRRATKRARHAQ